MHTLLALTLTAPAHAAAIGDPIDEALAIHVTNQGLARIGDTVEAMVPEAFTVEALSDTFECSPDDEVPLTYSLEELSLLLSTDEVSLVASDGRLDLTLYATLNSTAATLTASGDCSILADLDETCDVQLPTTAVEAHIGMVVTHSDLAFDVVVDDVSINISPVGNPVSGCTLESAIGTMLSQNPDAITDLLMSFVEPSIGDLSITIEESLEDVLNSLSMETSLAVGSANLLLELYPSLVELGDDGLVFGFGAVVQTDVVSDCFDSSGGSDLMQAGWPDFAATAADTSLNHDLALFVGRDFLDHLMFNLAASGLLCIDAGELLGGGITTGFVGSFMGEDFEDLFKDEQPALLLIAPVAAPVVEFHDDGPPLSLELDPLAMMFVARLDERMTRVFQVDMAASAGIAIDLEDNTLVTGLELGNDDMTFTEAYSELLIPGYSLGLVDIVGVMIGGLIPSDILPTVDLPDLMGLQVDALFWIPSTDGAWQGGYVVLDTSGVEPIETPSCSGGCDGATTDFDLTTAMGCGDMSAGCDGGGCAAVGGAARLFRGRLVLLALLAGLALRRRLGVGRVSA